jgi:predicted transcriptional regulator
MNVNEIEKCKNIAAIAGAEDASSGKSPNTSEFKFPDVYIAAYNQRVWWIDQRKKKTI